MGVLDDLKKEAEAKRKEQEQGSASAEETPGQRKVLTRLDDLYQYFKEFHATLTEANPEILVDVEVEGFGMLQGLRQGDYRLAIDDPAEVRKFQFHFKLQGRGRRELRIANRAVAAKQKENLWNANLKFSVVDVPGGSGGATITLEPLIPVSFDFEADLEKEIVRLRVKNMPRIGPFNYSYDADQVNAEFMDEVAKYVLRKPSRFDDLSGNTMTEETLTKIRQQLKQQQTQGGRPAAPAAADDKKESVTSKLKSVIKFRR